MKFNKVIFLFVVMLMAFTTVSAQNNGPKTIKIKVYGVCGMCKQRIENALDVKGIKYANWEQSDHTCEIVFKEDKITEEEIHHLLNEVGHDTEKSMATDEQYARVHECCRYREHEDHE